MHASQIDREPTLAERIAATEADLAGLYALRDEQWLAAIYASVTDHIFDIGDLRRHATVDDALAAVLQGMSNVQIGKRLRARAADVESRYRVERVGRDGDGVLWAVQVRDDLHPTPRVFADDGG